MLSHVLQKRYLARTWEEIVERVIKGPVWYKNTRFRPTVKQTKQLERALLTKTFIPAGNTLTYGAAPSTKLTSELRPNCCIIHDVTPAMAMSVWERGVGIGTTITDATRDPVEHLKALQGAWHASEAFGHRPKRGNMYVYPASGKYASEFIAVKSDPQVADQFPGFNISLGLRESDRFDKRHLLHALAESTWQSGDPGIVFLDRVNLNVPNVCQTSQIIQTMVPCGEQGMFDGETCTLGSLNLNSNALRGADGTFSYEKLEETVRIAVRFLDNAVDMTTMPQELHRGDAYRRIGLGVMGFADYLQREGLAYNSRAYLPAKKLSQFIGAVARDESCRLADERGKFSKSSEFKHSEWFYNQDRKIITRRSTEMRNVSVTCIAPTGGINLLTGNKGFSIEPIFGQTVSYETQLLVTDAWQSGMCNGVSKTVNMPKESTVKDMFDAIIFAFCYTQHLKAFSMYRDGSRKGQPL